MKKIISLLLPFSLCCNFIFGQEFIKTSDTIMTQGTNVSISNKQITFKSSNGDRIYFSKIRIDSSYFKNLLQTGLAVIITTNLNCSRINFGYNIGGTHHENIGSCHDTFLYDSIFISGFIVDPCFCLVKQSAKTADIKLEDTIAFPIDIYLSKTPGDTSGTKIQFNGKGLYTYTSDINTSISNKKKYNETKLYFPNGVIVDKNHCNCGVNEKIFTKSR